MLETTDPKTQPPQAGHPAQASGGKLNRGEIMRVILMAGFIVGGLTLLQATPLGRKLANAELLRNWLHQWGAWSWLVFLAVGTALLAFGFPRIAISAIAGALYGAFWGTVLGEIITTVSAIPAFYYTYILGREMVARRVGGRLQKFNTLLERHGFMVLLLIRLCPVGNAFVTNCMAGLSAIRFRAYLLSSAIGFLPMTIIFAWLGSSLTAQAHSQLRLWCSAGFFVVFSLIFLWYFKTSSLARDVMGIMRDEEKQDAANA